MSTTAQQVFELAMSLMDELNESSGSADTADTKEYKNRTLAILNVLRVECWPASDTYAVEEPGKRPICPEITGFTTALPLDDGICQGVLPYGLAAELARQGGVSELAQQYWETYERRKREIRLEELYQIYGVS